jgi:hypothetical protein
VHEFSRLENRFIVRDRHAHAWALVYVDDTWYNFDTTPGTWISIEDGAAPGWELVTDLGSWCWFNLTQGFMWARQSNGFTYLGWLIIPAVLLMARRIFGKKRVRRPNVEKPSPPVAAPTPAGMDSEFYLIENALIKSGYVRHPAETLDNWIKRLPPDRITTHLIDDLKSILNLHYRYRFDPKGIGNAEKSALIADTRAWLDAYHSAMQGRHETQETVKH